MIVKWADVAPKRKADVFGGELQIIRSIVTPQFWVRDMHAGYYVVNVHCPDVPESERPAIEQRYLELARDVRDLWIQQ